MRTATLHAEESARNPLADDRAQFAALLPRSLAMRLLG